MTISPSKSTTRLSFRFLMLTTFSLAILTLVGCISVVTDDELSGAIEEERVSNTFIVSSNPTINLNSFNGSIEIVPGDEGVVEVEAKFRLPDRVTYSASVENNSVTVVARKTGSGFNFGRSPGAELKVTAPKESTIKANTSNGRIELTGIVGDSGISTSNGVIVLSDVTGTISAETSNGRINISNAAGQFDAHTSNGSIEFSGSFSSSSNNSFSTSNGSISVRFTDEPDMQIDARTSNGSVTTVLPILTTTSEKSQLVGRFGSGSSTLKMRSSNGSISLE